MHLASLDGPRLSADTSARPESIIALVRTGNRTFWMLGIVTLLAGIAAKPCAAPAQALEYERTTFLHGFGSNPQIWTTPYSGLIGLTSPGYLAQTVDLGTVGTANLGLETRYNAQRDSLSNYLAVQEQRHVLVGHSLGSLVARGTYLHHTQRRPNIAGILAVAPVHQGAPLADNAEAARDFFLDVKWRFDGGADAVSFLAYLLDFAVSLLIDLPVMVFTAFASQIGTLDIEDAASLALLPAVQDIRPQSTAIQEQIANFGDGSIARANLTGSIPFLHAVLRIQASLDNDEGSFNSLKRNKNQAMSLFTACKYIGYATIVLSSKGRACSKAKKALGRIDWRWAGYVNGMNALGQPRQVPFDGVVPNENQQYPGLTDPLMTFHAENGNHQNLFKVSRGVDLMAEAMERMNMRTVSGGGGDPPALTASISGPTSIGEEGSYSWYTNVAGGTGSYAYNWEISYDGGGSWWSVGSGASHNEPYISGTDSFHLRVTVTSGTQAVTPETYVYVDTTCGGYIC